MTRLKVKVKATPKLLNRPFSTSISSAVCDPIFEISSDSDNMEQYLNLVGPVFLIRPGYRVTCLQSWKNRQ